MHFAIFGRYFKEERFVEIQQFFSHLDSHKINVSIYKSYYDDCLRSGINFSSRYKTFSTYEDFGKLNVDYVISIGGAAPTLHPPEFIRKAEIPVVGTNTGRLGFLAS